MKSTPLLCKTIFVAVKLLKYIFYAKIFSSDRHSSTIAYMSAVSWLVFRFASVRTASNYMILSLSCADLLMSVKMPIALYNGYYGGPELGVSGAKVSSDV